MNKVFHLPAATRALAILVVGFGVFMIGHSAFALTLVPPSLEFGVNPGQTLTSSIKLFNESNTATTLYTSTANFTAGDDQGSPNFDFKHSTTDLATWITTSPSQLTLQPGDRVSVTVTVKVPANAEAGGHYAAVFFGTQPPATQGSGVSIASKVGTLMILRVAGAIRESAHVSSFAAVGKGMFTRLPIDFKTVVLNDGNIHVRPAGNVVVKNMFGGTTKTIAMNDAQGAVLPNSTREFTVTWQKNHTAEPKGNFFTEISREARNFAFGPYTVSLAATYGQTNIPLTSQIHIFVFPWHYLLAAALGLAVIIFLVVWLLQGYNRMIIRRATGRRGIV